jgi:hypothetical protein
MDDKQENILTEEGPPTHFPILSQTLQEITEMAWQSGRKRCSDHLYSMVAIVHEAPRGGCLYMKLLDLFFLFANIFLKCH